jgi:hypothetical protein
LTNRFTYLLTPVYLGALVLLVLNDFIFKPCYANFLTGKISDFAGLFLFPVLICALLNSKSRFIFILAGLGFIFWKSSFSSGFIAGWNEWISFLPLKRVIDYSDLAALGVLPFSWIFIHSEARIIKINPVLPLLFSCFAITATSYRMEEPLNETFTVEVPKYQLNGIIRHIPFVKLSGPEFSTDGKDTTEIFLENEICNSGFYIIMTAEPVDKKHTSVTLSEARYNCKKEDHYKEIIDTEVSKFIDRLKNYKP